MADTELNPAVKLESEIDFEAEQNYSQYEDGSDKNVKSEFDLDYQYDDLYHQDSEDFKEEYANYEEEVNECK